MKTTILAITSLMLLATVVMAQIPDRQTPAYQDPHPYQEDNNCLALKVKMLHLATDPSDPQQNGYLTASHAYHELYEAGQTC